MVLRADNVEISEYDSTKVTFNELDYQDLDRYIASGESMDKAGAYGIQGMGSFLVKRYEGEFDTVIGFPTKLFTRMLGEVISCRNR
jgi:septum formation protein